MLLLVQVPSSLWALGIRVLENTVFMASHTLVSIVIENAIYYSTLSQPLCLIPSWGLTLLGVIFKFFAFFFEAAKAKRNTTGVARGRRAEPSRKDSKKQEACHSGERIGS